MSNNDARVLWVLSDEQRAEFSSEIEGAGRDGVGFIFRSSPEDALDEVPELAPQLVIVGVTNDEMDGLEFLAMLMRPKLGFTGKVIVLPDRGDPYPPMLQWRDEESGRSATEEITLEALGEHVAALVESERPSAEYYVSSSAGSPSGLVPESNAVPAGLFGDGGAEAAKPVAKKRNVARPAGARAPVRRPAPGGAERPFGKSPKRPAAAPKQRQVDSGMETLPPPSDGPSVEDLVKASLGGEAEKLATTLPPPQDSVEALATEWALAPVSPEEPATVLPAPIPTAEAATPVSLQSPDVSVAAGVSAVPEDSSAPAAIPSASTQAAEASPPTAVEPVPEPSTSNTAQSATTPATNPVPYAPQAEAVPEPPTNRAMVYALVALGLLALLGIGGFAISQMGGDSTPEPVDELPDTTVPADTTVPPDTNVPPTGDPDPPPENPEPAPPEPAPFEGEEADDPEAAAAHQSDLFEPTTLPVTFHSGVARFIVDDQDRLAEIVAQLRAALDADPNAVVEVGGHTSRHGSDEVNQTLGRRRASQVRDYLVARRIPLERIVLRNYHSSSPAERAEGEGHGVHRRVTVRVID